MAVSPPIEDVEIVVIVQPEDFEAFPQLTDSLVTLASRLPGNRLRPDTESDSTLIYVCKGDYTIVPDVVIQLENQLRAFEAHRARLNFYDKYEEKYGPDTGRKKTAGERAQEAENTPMDIQDLVCPIEDYPGFQDALDASLGDDDE